MFFIARPDRRAQETQSLLEEKKIQSFILPPADIVFDTQQQKEFKEHFQHYDAWIITSLYALEALPFTRDEISLMTITLYCVGQKTAQKAKEMGFQNIKNPPDENSASLAQLIAQEQQHHALAYLTTDQRRPFIEYILKESPLSCYMLYHVKKKNDFLDHHKQLFIKDISPQIICFSNNMFHHCLEIIQTHYPEKKDMIQWHLIGKYKDVDIKKCFFYKNYHVFYGSL